MIPNAQAQAQSLLSRFMGQIPFLAAASQKPCLPGETSKIGIRVTGQSLLYLIDHNLRCSSLLGWHLQVSQWLSRWTHVLCDLSFWGRHFLKGPSGLRSDSPRGPHVMSVCHMQSDNTFYYLASANPIRFCDS